MPDALMVTSSFLPGRGGIESYLAELCSQVAPRIAVLGPRQRDGVPIPHGLGYPTHGLENGSMLVPSKRVVRTISTLAAHYRTTKVIFGTPWPLGLLGPDLTRRGLSYAVIVHGAEMLVPAAVPGLSQRLARAMAGAELLLPVSGYTGDALRELIQSHGLPVPPIERLHARVDLDRFHPGVDTAGVRTRLGLSPTDKVVLCFGRLVKRKGIDRLVAALPAINKRLPGAVVVIAGTGPEQARLEKLARASEGRVIVAGRVEDSEAPAFYALADVFALPVADRFFGLEVEGLGVVLLEAAASGTPCVTGRSGGTPEAVIGGSTGFVVDAEDVGVLADRIAWLLEHPERATEMGSAGREHVRKDFSALELPTSLLGWLSDGLP
ncbi:MAG TPA: glycosyltransferase family 4 protein [Actinomycetota bacterium]|nr:glycosyltransferase family 4 protein [Actinomycetota bacterium]